MHIQLKASLRNKGEQQKPDTIPAVSYGPNSKNKNLLINYRDFAKIYERAGQSTLVDLIVDDKDPIKALIQDIQKNPVSDKFIHVDFYELDMNKKLTVEVELIYKGIAEVEKATGGEVIKNLSALHVECLPKDLVKEITINIADKLREIGQSLNASEIKLPAGLELTTDPENSVVSVQEIKEEIIEQPKEEGTEGEEKEKKEGEGEEKEGEESASSADKSTDKSADKSADKKPEEKTAK